MNSQSTHTQTLLEQTPPAVAILAANAAATEHQGRPTQASLEAVSKIQGFAMTVPTSMGGSEINLETTGRVLIELGSGCPATAWVTGTGNTSKRFMGLGVHGAYAQHALGEPNTLFCGSGAPNGQVSDDGNGLRVSGRWPMISGCEDASTMVLGVMHLNGDNTPPVYSMIHLPTASATIETSWDAAGMRGTGSHTVVLTDLSIEPSAMAAVSPTSAFVVAGSVDVLAPLIGATQAALSLVGGLFADRDTSPGSKHSPLSASPGARQLLAEATQLLSSARRRVLDVCMDFDQSPDTAAMTPVEASAARIEFAAAGQEIRQSFEKMLDLHGASGFAVDNPLQRLWRDVSVGTRHPLLKAYPIIENRGTLLVS